MTDQWTDLKKRPSPDALLAEARREHKGRLKIFLGAAPGVGKTYEMLSEARAKLRDGMDVVVGIVETHGRAETEALLAGLEVIPRKPTIYVGKILSEFDIDKALQRRPKLILVDELAHTNIPGSRHPKRYQDVEELLDAGIDVYTTVNIQHIESLNDVVAQITKVRVREIVPDSMLERAASVELVDLTPEDLIQRLKEGKVYIPHLAKRALSHFFSPPNLTALRELALRKTAEHVDEQLLEHMQARAIPGPWAAGERILVCVDEEPRSVALVRYAKRLADRLRAPWTALCIEDVGGGRLGNEEKERIADTLRLAERLGGEALSIPAKARRTAGDILDYAQRSNVTHVIVGKAPRSAWFEFLHGSVVHDLVRSAGDISVHVMAGKETAEPAKAKGAVATDGSRPVDPAPYLIALMAVASALGVSLLIKPFLGVENVDLVFLTAVIGVAVLYGLWPSLLASVAASLCYNFFFLPPVYTFTITDPTNIAAFVFFTVLSIVVSNLASRLRSQTVGAQDRVRTLESLYGFSRKLAGGVTLDDVLWATAFQIASMLKARVVLLLPDGTSLAVKAGYPPEDTLDESDFAAAKWAWDKNRIAGRDSDALPGAKWLFVPMRTGRGKVAVLGITRDAPGRLLQSGQRPLLDALADQGALAIERVHLVEDVERVNRAAETERLRSALLTSISHDLRTPLASVLGSAGALRDLSSSLDEASKADLLATIIEEAERLNRFIANLLDMTKLESGAVSPKLSPHDVGEVVGTALQRGVKILAQHRVQVDLETSLPMVNIDAVLLEQAIFNLLDNAAKYAPPGTTIEIGGWRDRDNVVIRIGDNGPGIPESELEMIFDKFHRARKGDHIRAGTGLGLAICRGFIEAMGGSITAGNRSDGTGASFTISLPADSAASEGRK